MTNDNEGTSVAIVTGAARGIGQSAALQLARGGHDIVLIVRTAESGRPVADAVEALGRSALVIACDVADADAAKAAVEAGWETFGHVDVLVNNAGIIQPIAALADVSAREWARSIEVNLIGAFNMVRAVLPRMLELGGGTIINLSSGAAHRPLEGWSAYCAAKAGVAMLTQSLALEYGARGIRVFGFAPGTTDTEMQSLIRASGINPISRIKRSDLVPVSEPAAAIAYLCTPAADDLAGKEITLNDPALRRRMGIRELALA